MSRLLVRYIGAFSAISITFSGFVACGTQMYKVSVRDDINHSNVQGANPLSTDKTSPQYGIHAPSGWKKTPIPFRFSPELNAQQKTHLMAAMERWEWATGKHLFAYEGDHAGVTGDSFKDLYGSLGDDVNGHYLDNNWSKTQKPDFVLATTIWDNERDFSIIAKADIRFNNQHYIIGDSLELKATPDREVVDMQSLALHELGHFLGLSHVDEDMDSVSIMNPSLFIGEGLTSRKMSRGDIERIQAIYGCAGKACNIDALIDEMEIPDGEKFTLKAQKWLQSKGTSPTAN